MPRTKKPTHKSAQTDEKQTALRKEIRVFLAEQERLLDQAYENQIEKLELSVKMMKTLLGEENLKKTIGQLRSELVMRDVNNTTLMNSHSEKRPGSDDGSVNKSVKRRRSRSCAPPSARKPARPMRAIYQTPAYNKAAGDRLPAITPKMAPNVAPSILRQPRQGEMVVSMSGSPLMVHGQHGGQLVNCNIPLFDGTVISVLPEKFRPSTVYLPVALMDEEVLQQLKTLNENIEAVVKAGQAKIS